MQLSAQPEGQGIAVGLRLSDPEMARHQNLAMFAATKVINSTPKRTNYQHKIGASWLPFIGSYGPVTLDDLRRGPSYQDPPVHTPKRPR
jgi:hypothetical protein